MTQLEPPAAKPRDDGFLIVAVLWIVAMLATLVVMYSFYTRQATGEMLAVGERAQALALAESGVELAVYQITADPQVRPATGRFSFRQGRAVVDVEFTSENSRINLNFASTQVLAGLFRVLGAQQPEALEFAERIVAWRSPPAADAQDNETPLYLAAGRKYGPRHGPFQHVDELGLVLDIPAWLIHRARPYLTVYSESADINMIGASPEVLAALPGVSPDLVKLLLGQRGNISNDVLMTQLGMAASYITMLPGLSNRIDVDVAFPTGRHVRAEAVVLVRPDDVEPYRVLAWRDEDLAKD